MMLNKLIYLAPKQLINLREEIAWGKASLKVLFSVVFISCLNQQIASAAVNKTIRVVTTKTLYNAFGSSETTKNYASAKINDLKYSFAEFGISFTPTFSIITYNAFPSDDCPLSPLSICTASCASALTLDINITLRI